MQGLRFRVATIGGAAWLLMALCVCGAGPSADADAVLAEKAKELTAESNGRTARVIALQSFVRDEIRQVDTRYG